MRKNPDFELITIENVNYLLPSGQAICDHKRGIKINETGALIWNLADNAKTGEELIKACLDEMEISDEDAEQAGNDIGEYIDSLIQAGIFYEDDADNETQSGSVILDSPAEIKMYAAKPLRLEIAGIKINLFCDRADLDPKLLSFKSGSGNNYDSPDQTICVIYSVPPAGGLKAPLICGNDMRIFDYENGYIISYDEYSPVKEVHMSNDGSMVTIYAPKAPDLTYHLFHAIRLPFLFLAEKNNKYAIHSASILYKDRAWLFSAPAGTGKSTHAALWNKFLDTPNINGDLNLIGIENEAPVIWGIPWCGTSEIYDNITHKLGGVIFLKRSDEDKAEQFDVPSGLVALTRRTISPVWNTETLKNMISDLLPLAQKIYLARLYCTKEPSAQKTIQAAIDEYLIS